MTLTYQSTCTLKDTRNGTKSRNKTQPVRLKRIQKATRLISNTNDVFRDTKRNVLASERSMMPTAAFPVMSYSSSTIFKALISSNAEDVSAQVACFHVGQKVCGRD